VAVVTLDDGRVLNEELLKNGHAWLYTAYCKTARCADWQKLEAGARLQKAGLWRDKKPVAPWQWRRRHSR
jgi:endonuclease YncB( thermonuclease family)